MMSAIGMLGTPSEIYRFGTQAGIIMFSFPLVMYSVANWYLPVFWKIGVSTSYEVKLNLVIALSFLYYITIKNTDVTLLHINIHLTCLLSTVFRMEV